MTQKYYLEDLSIGQRFAAGPIAIGEEEMIRFARAYDPQHFHLDPEAAKSSFFGGLVGSGWLTAAITMRLLIEGAAPFAGGVIGTGGELAWPRPVRPGDQLRVEAEVTAITLSRKHADRGNVAFTVRTLNQRDELVQSLTAKLVVFARPKASSDR